MTRFTPIANRLFNEISFRTVMRQQFRLCLSDLWELRFQNVCNALMVVLSRALQQRLEGSILNECVLKHVGGLRWYTALVHEFCIYQPSQFTLHSGFV